MKKRKGKALKRSLVPYKLRGKLRVMAEYDSSGIWMIRQMGVFRHGMVDHATLRLPPELARGFEQWIAQYEDQYENPEGYDYIAFNAEGRRLAQALKRHFGEEASVEFQPETAEGSIGPSEEILLSDDQNYSA